LALDRALVLALALAVILAARRALVVNLIAGVSRLPWQQSSEWHRRAEPGLP